MYEVHEENELYSVKNGLQLVTTNKFKTNMKGAELVNIGNTTT